MWWLWGLLACEPRTPEAAQPLLADQARYRAALAAADPVEAVRLCGEIGDDRLRRECLVFEAGDLRRAGGDAQRVCAGLDTPEWQAVCFFELVDRGGLRGEAALAACQQTGAFQQRCVAHALQREERALAQQFPPGQEAAMAAHIQALVARYSLEDAEEEALDVVMVGRLIAERKRQRAPQAPFSRADCGSASDVACAEAYRALVLRAGGEGKAPEDCALPMDPARVAALGLPVWTAELQPLADTVWAQLCRRQRTPSHRPPDYQHSQRSP